MIQHISDEGEIECYVRGSSDFDIRLVQIGLSVRNQLSLGFVVEPDDDDEDFGHAEAIIEQLPPG
jgi:hypothetical protein